MEADFPTPQPIPTYTPTIFDALNFGVVCVNKNLEIKIENNHAKDLLSGNTCLNSKNNRLHALGQGNHDLLARNILLAINERKESRIVFKKKGKQNICASIKPDRSDSFSSNGLISIAIVFFHTPNRQSLEDIQNLASQFGLTAKEAAYCQHLLDGKSIKKIAETTGYSLATSQWYCKQIMSKLGVKRQPELILKLVESTVFY